MKYQTAIILKTKIKLVVLFVCLLSFQGCSYVARPGRDVRTRKVPQSEILVKKDIERQDYEQSRERIVYRREFNIKKDDSLLEEKPEEDHVDMLIQNLKSDNTDVRRRAVWALGEVSDIRAVEPLINALKDENRSIQVNVIDSLGKMGGLAVEPLLQALKNDDRAIRLNAAKALRKLKDPEAVELLIAALEDESAYVRLNAAKALGSIKDPEAVIPLIEALEDGNVYVRKNAVWSLGRIKDQMAIEHLIEMLNDRNPEVREAVVWAFRMMKDPLVISPLITVLEDEEEKVSDSAVEALEEITGENFEKDIIKWNEWWELNRPEQVEEFITEDISEINVKEEY